MEHTMCGENKNEKKAKIFSCCGSEGITEMMKGCFPDDAGFTDCLAKINEGRKNSVVRKLKMLEIQLVNR